MNETAAPRAYRNPNWRTDNADLESALDAFWNVAYTQGHEQRGHDDEAGTAQKAEDELRRVIAGRDSITKAEDLYEIAEALGCECDAKAIVRAVGDLKSKVSVYRKELAATVREGISAVADARQSPSTPS